MLACTIGGIRLVQLLRGPLGDGLLLVALPHRLEQDHFRGVVSLATGFLVQVGDDRVAAAAVRREDDAVVLVEFDAAIAQSVQHGADVGVGRHFAELRVADALGQDGDSLRGARGAHLRLDAVLGDVAHGAVVALAPACVRVGRAVGEAVEVQQHVGRLAWG